MGSMQKFLTLLSKENIFSLSGYYINAIGPVRWHYPRWATAEKGKKGDPKIGKREIEVQKLVLKRVEDSNSKKFAKATTGWEVLEEGINAIMKTGP